MCRSCRSRCTPVTLAHRVIAGTRDIEHAVALSNPLDQARDSAVTAVRSQVCKCGVYFAASPPDQYALRMGHGGAHKKSLKLRAVASRRQECSVDRSQLVACQRRA